MSSNDTNLGMAEIGTFIASVAHEIKTPMNGLLGYLQLLQRTSLNTTQSQYVTSMQQCSVQLMQIINDVLDFSKLSSGRMTLAPQCFSPAELESDISDILGQRIQEKKQRCKYIIGDEVPTHVVMDKHKLIQIMVNLISNANKFTGIGGFIEVSIHKVGESKLRVAVKDTGVGIAEKDSPKLFDTFVQLKESTYKTGSGLGLAITKKLVLLLNGEVQVSSELGIGSVFSCTVTYKDVNDYEKEIKKDIARLKGKKVLVVDDNVDNRILLNELLFEWKMQPVVCSSALEALRLILGNHYEFSVGLIDICMEGISGIELAKQIKQERPLFPLIALSSLEEGLPDTSNFESKLDKPINKVQLFNEIYKIVTNKRRESAYLSCGEDSHSDSSAGSPSHSFNKCVRVLVADDISHNRDMVRDMLEELGYSNVECAVDGVDAVEKIDQSHANAEPYDILLLDLLMPKMNGHKVLEDMVKKGYKVPKTIVITASVMEEDREKCRKNGVNYFITKPIEMGQLSEIMLHCCERI